MLRHLSILTRLRRRCKHDIDGLQYKLEGVSLMSEQTELRETVRARYAAAATAVTQGGGGCCGPDAVEVDENFGATLYPAAQHDELPAEAVAASLGCGNPIAVAELREGERVLDLGSGGGIDVLLSARRVGSTGKAYGLDMTDEMLALALSNAEKAGATNVELLKGNIEAIPLPGNTIDVISNCVINLSVDKPAVFAETFRVLRPGGRIGISDVIADDHLTPTERAERGSYVSCIAGALTFTEYREGLEAAGFVGIEITPTFEAADGMHSAIVRAVKPLDLVRSTASTQREDSCCGVNACCTSDEEAVDPDRTVVEAKTASGCGCQSHP
ncbi:arsenite methyltransferase [Lentzea sp. NPDC051208]|uniref:arsenite methyltransferase n=1 Tax=Lentzea sp. NPDC051208 TaxID=3154642 RepID=UPI003449C312